MHAGLDGDQDQWITRSRRASPDQIQWITGGGRLGLRAQRGPSPMDHAEQRRRQKSKADGGDRGRTVGKIQMLMLRYVLPASQDARIACLPLRQCTNITD